MIERRCRFKDRINQDFRKFKRKGSKKKIFFYLYVIMITFRALEEFVKEKLPAFGDEKRDYILSVKLSRLQIIRREFV